MQANINVTYNNHQAFFHSPMSCTSSCTSSPFSSPETGVELENLDMPMFLPNEPSIYHQILDIDGSNDFMQQQSQYQMYAPLQQKQQQFQYNGVAQIGLGTPPTSPPAPAFHKYPSVGTEMGTMFYGSQPQAIQNAYVTSTEPIPILQQHPLQQQQQTVQRQQQEQEMYRLLLQQFDNLESSLFSPSPIISSCSSSLSNSPYLESPLMAVASDFDLFPMNNAAGTRQAAVSGYPSAPVMAPPSSPTTQAMYSQTGGYHQLTPPTNPIDLESGTCSLFKHDAFSNTQQPMTTELSMLCKCPGKFPCGEQLPTDSIESVSPVGSPLEDIHESDNNESDFGSEEEDQQQELEHDSDPTYVPTHARSTKASRSKSMVINTSVSAPYSSPYSKDPAPSPKTPVRQDKRRSSSGSFSSFGHSHNQQLLDPNMVPEIKDIHVCPVCDRRFTRPFNLRSHLMTHTTARPFPCDECHWKFTRQHDLLRHKRAKHPNSVNTAPTTGQKKTSANKSRSASAA